MWTHNTDRDWEIFGSTEPYYGVLTQDRYRQSNLTDAGRQAFFRSGEDHVAELLATIRRYVDPTHNPRNVLDYGCGVGRLVLPFARFAETVTGSDVSEAMLREARHNCQIFGIRNVELVIADDHLSRVKGTFDLVHSFIVFQHIPPQRGQRIFQELLARLNDGGVAAIQLTYAKSHSHSFSRLVPWVKNHVPYAKNAIAWLRGRGFSSPEMQMNPYDLNPLLMRMQQGGIDDFYSRFTDHGGELGLWLIFKKPLKQRS